MLVVVLIVATCGLVYELLAGTVASWVLGDSVTQFSTVIGLYLSALGLGSYLSRFLCNELPRRFVQIEIAIAWVGGLTAPVLFLLFAHPAWFRVVLYLTVLASGTLVGLEIPILLRVLHEHQEFKTVVSRVFAYDHLGSLLGSVLYSLALLPRLGPLRTGLLFGMVNAAVALWSTHLLRSRLGRAVGALRLAAVVTMAVLLVVLIYTRSVMEKVESEALAWNETQTSEAAT